MCSSGWVILPYFQHSPKGQKGWLERTEVKKNTHTQPYHCEYKQMTNTVQVTEHKPTFFFYTTLTWGCSNQLATAEQLAHLQCLSAANIFLCILLLLTPDLFKYKLKMTVKDISDLTACDVRKLSYDEVAEDESRHVSQRTPYLLNR